MAESHLTAAERAAGTIVHKSADAVVAEACGTAVSDSEIDWEATTFSRHELPDFHKLEGRQCAVYMAGYIAERLYLGHPWQQDEAALRSSIDQLALSDEEQTEPTSKDEASQALLIIRSYHPELNEDELVSAYRQHERETHEWLQQIDVWTAVLEKARALGLSEAGVDD